MKKEEIENMLNEIGIPYKYHHFTQKELEGIALPVLVWNIPGTDNFFADGQTYHKIQKLDIEIYSDQKGWVLEEKVEKVLSSHGMAWEQAASAWLESESMWETLYEMEV